MDALTAILTRRSIRRFTPEPVSGPHLRTLLQAAVAAPSARNLQPREYVVLDDRGVLDAIASFHPYAKMLRMAPLAILVCADETRQPLEGYWLQDCSAATENLLLAAHALGLGACWVGIQPRPERIRAIREIIGLPQTVHPVSLVAIGHPAEQKAPSERLDWSRVHWNRYGIPMRAPADDRTSGGPA